jgi:hypothetical protein
MSLIIEGSDCLGKTTFAKKVVRYVLDHDKFPAYYAWMTRPNENNFDFLCHYKMIINPCIVQDRFHLGAISYHKNKLSLQNRMQVEQWIEEQGGMIVVLYASDFDWYEQLIREDERGNLLSWPILCEANKIFTEIAQSQKKLGPPFFAFNISEGRYLDDEVVKRVSDLWITRRHNKCSELYGKVQGEN